MPFERPRRTPTGLALALLSAAGLCASCDLYKGGLLGPGAARSVEPPGTVSATCGDGKVEGTELCDTAIDAGMEGSCPTVCESPNPCQPRVAAGVDCQAQCAGLSITEPHDGDGCCPPGAGAGEDSDCDVCGDEIVGPLETCDPPAKCHTREACSLASMCVVGVYTGAAELCTAGCHIAEIKDCLRGDGCCPAGCDADSDNDCSASCGNGVVEANETCELASDTSPCPSSCDDGIACTRDLTTGSVENCNLQCVHQEILNPAEGDGCCPPNSNNSNDSDCLPVCGNNVPESGESCDPCPENCDDSDPCTADSPSGSGCTISCQHARISATVAGDGCCPIGANATTDGDCTPACGNLVLEAGEECDGGPQCDGNCDRAVHGSIAHRYSFDSSGTTVSDRVGEADGTLRDGASMSGGAVTLSGGSSGGYVQLPAGLVSSRSAITVEAWVRWTTSSEARQRLFECAGKSGSEGTNFLFITPRSGADNRFAAYLNVTNTVNDTAADRVVADSAALTTANPPAFHQVAATFDGTTLKLYLDGAAKGAAATVQAGEALADIDDDYCSLGHSVFDGAPEFGGVVTELRIYNQALSAGEIAISNGAGPDP